MISKYIMCIYYIRELTCIQKYDFFASLKGSKYCKVTYSNSIFSLKFSY